MHKIKAKNSQLVVPEIALGCMRIAKMEVKDVETLLKTSLEEGINYFDHADFYGGGQSEVVFAKAVKMGGINREDLLIQSKCGISHEDWYYDR